MLSRRLFLGGLLAAPAIVRAESLMKVKPHGFILPSWVHAPDRVISSKWSVSKEDLLVPDTGLYSHEESTFVSTGDGNWVAVDHKIHFQDHPRLADLEIGRVEGFRFLESPLLEPQNDTNQRKRTRNSGLFNNLRSRLRT